MWWDREERMTQTGGEAMGGIDGSETGSATEGTHKLRNSIDVTLIPL